MCGIIASISHTPRFNNVFKVKQQYEAQKERGQQGFGFVAVQKDDVVFCRTTTEEKIMEELDKLDDPSVLLFHHRIPTSSPNAVNANHPILIQNDDLLDFKYFVIHNGHISNSDERKKEHEKMGFSYATNVKWKYGKDGVATYDDYTDSEALAIDMALYAEGKLDTIPSSGSFAGFMLQVTKNNNPVAVYYARNSSPIKFYCNQDGSFFSSTGKGYMLDSDIMYKLDFTDKLVSKSPISPTNDATEEEHPTQEDSVVNYADREMGYDLHREPEETEEKNRWAVFDIGNLADYSVYEKRADRDTIALMQERELLMLEVESLGDQYDKLLDEASDASPYMSYELETLIKKANTLRSKIYTLEREIDDNLLLE